MTVMVASGQPVDHVPAVRERDDVVVVAVPPAHRDPDVGRREAPVAGEQHQVAERRRGLEAAAVEQVVEEHRLELRTRQQRSCRPRRLHRGVQVEAGAGQRPDHPDRQRSAPRRAAPGQRRAAARAGRPAAMIPPPAASGPARGRDAAEHPDPVDPLRQRGARGQHVGPAAGQPDQRHGVDGQRVEQDARGRAVQSMMSGRGTASTSRCRDGRCR